MEAFQSEHVTSSAVSHRGSFQVVSVGQRMSGCHCLPVVRDRVLQEKQLKRVFKVPGAGRLKADVEVFSAERAKDGGRWRELR